MARAVRGPRCGVRRHDAALDSAGQPPRTMEWCRRFRDFRGEGFPAACSRSRYLPRAHRSMVPADLSLDSGPRTSDIGFRARVS